MTGPLQHSNRAPQGNNQTSMSGRATRSKVDKGTENVSSVDCKKGPVTSKTPSVDERSTKAVFEKLAKEKLDDMVMEMEKSMVARMKESISIVMMEMEKSMEAKIKEGISVELEKQKEAMMNVEMQKTVVAEDLNRIQKERGGYKNAEAFLSDPCLAIKIEKYDFGDILKMYACWWLLNHVAMLTSLLLSFVPQVFCPKKFRGMLLLAS
jgi:hypothetical protein